MKRAISYLPLSIRQLSFCVLSLALLLSFINLTQSPVYAQTATLSLSPSVGTFNKGCSFSLEVKLNTGGAETDGTDAILLYDASRVSATSITNGTIYSDYPGNNIDDNNGKVTVSGLASVASPYNGTGTLATVNFTVKDTAPTGAIQVKFDFDANDKAKTTDSNVVQRGTVADILNSVVNGSYTVGTGSCSAQTTPTPNPSPAKQPNNQGAPITSTSSAQLSCPAPGQVGTHQLADCNNQWGYDQCSVTARDSKGRPLGYSCSYSGNNSCQINLRCNLPDGGTTEVTSAIAIVGGVLTILGILGLALL